MQKQLFPCDRCEGVGRIQAFNHVLSGVCFKCAGSGKLARKPAPKKLTPLTPFQEKRIHMIRTLDMSTLDYRQLLGLRDDAHWHYRQYPDLRSVWMERGEPYFQAAQAERLAAL